MKNKEIRITGEQIMLYGEFGDWTTTSSDCIVEMMENVILDCAKEEWYEICIELQSIKNKRICNCNKCFFKNSSVQEEIDSLFEKTREEYPYITRKDIQIMMEERLKNHFNNGRI